MTRLAFFIVLLLLFGCSYTNSKLNVQPVSYSAEILKCDKIFSESLKAIDERNEILLQRLASICNSVYLGNANNWFYNLFPTLMRFISFVLITLLAVSCNQVDIVHKDYRDSVIEKYFAMVDSSGQHDTADEQYRLLKAYLKNDTISLKKIDSSIFVKKTERGNWDLWTSDIPLPQLKQLNADEAYRFILSRLGSTTYEAITVYKKDTSFKLQYLPYIHDRMGARFAKGRVIEKNISKDEWEIMTNSLLKADYWGLKPENEVRGDDGGDLTVIGYYESGYNVRNQYVHRWQSGTLGEAFFYVYSSLLDKKDHQFSIQ